MSHESSRTIGIGRVNPAFRDTIENVTNDRSRHIPTCVVQPLPSKGRRRRIRPPPPVDRYGIPLFPTSHNRPVQQSDSHLQSWDLYPIGQLPDPAHQHRTKVAGCLPQFRTTNQHHQGGIVITEEGRNVRMPSSGNCNIMHPLTTRPIPMEHKKS